MSEPAKPYTWQELQDVAMYGPTPKAWPAVMVESERLKATAAYIGTLEEEKRVLQGRIGDLEARIRQMTDGALAAKEMLVNKRKRIDDLEAQLAAADKHNEILSEATSEHLATIERMRRDDR